MFKCIDQSDVKHIMTSPINTITSVLKASTDIITKIQVLPIRLTEILAIMSVSTFKITVIPHVYISELLWENILILLFWNVVTVWRKYHFFVCLLLIYIVFFFPEQIYVFEICPIENQHAAEVKWNIKLIQSLAEKNKQTLREICYYSSLFFHAIKLTSKLSFWKDFFLLSGTGLWFMVFNATFNNISVISWQLVLLVKKNQRKSLTCHKSPINFIT